MATILRTARRSLLESRLPTSIFSRTAVIPSRNRSFNSTAQIIDTPSDALNLSKDAPPMSKIVSASPSTITPTTLANGPTDTSSTPAQTPTPVPISKSIQKLLPLLLAQPSHFITAHIHGRPYLLTPGDTLRLPFKMPGVTPGDVLRLNRASSIGSRDYTLKGSGEHGYVDERIFECRATVMGVESEPVRKAFITKRRNRRVRTKISKHKYTILRIGQITVKTLGELKGALAE